MLLELEKEIEKFKNPEKAKILSRFFKTGKGEYGEGDIFLGITVPISRALAKQFPLNLNEIDILIASKEHEKRLIALFALINLYKKSKNKEEIIDYYLSKTQYINNWDLVDLSCYKILGDYLCNGTNYDILIKLSKSKNLWERRIAIISTMAFIRKGNFNPTLELSKQLLKNEHELINKAVGWLLREIGKRDLNVLYDFLNNNISNFSSISLSYATEKLSKEEREKFRMMRKKK